MPRFSANLTLLFNEVDFIDRFSAAAAAGFEGVEVQFPYEHTAEQVLDELGENNLSLVLFNLPAGDLDADERGIACLPDRVGEFQDSVETALIYAAKVGCTQLNCLVGKVPWGMDGDTVRRTLIDNLRFAARETGKEGIKLLIEPINNRDVPEFYLNTSKEALEVMDEAGSTNLWLQYDLYHMQTMEGDLSRTIESNLRKIAHMQIADAPDRHEPGTGEINFDYILPRIDRLGYEGWIGCEYNPSGLTLDSLGWMRPYLRKADAA